MDEDPFVGLAGTTVVEADSRRAVARQEAVAELDNHARLRHAGALFAAGYAASRALVAAALGPRASSFEAMIGDSEITYQNVVRGAVIATAEPADQGWDEALAKLADGREAQLRTAVKLRSEEGTVTTAMTVLWQVARKPGPNT